MNLLNGIDQMNSLMPGQQPWNDIRTASLAKFQQLGVPTRKDEDWKYTSLKPLTDQFFAASAVKKVLGSKETYAQIKQTLSKNYTNLIFVNGFFIEHLSDPLPQGLSMVMLSELIQKKDKAKFFDVITRHQKSYHALDYLNDSFLGQGVQLTVAKECLIKKPIKMTLFTSLESGVALACYPKIFIQVEEKAKATILVSSSGEPSARYYVNEHFYLSLERDSNLSFVQLQDNSQLAIHTAHVFSDLESGASLHSLLVSLGGALTRNNVDIFHNGEESTSKLDGVYVLNGDQHSDFHTCIDHVVGRCLSQQFYKGVLNDKARVVFNGKVKIQKGSDLANSEQLNQNLLLSSTAEVDTKPELEILADDVKATHGATIGDLNEEEVFYLTSRAIDRKQATQMLGLGFVSELVYKLEDRQIVNDVLQLAQHKLKDVL